MSEQQESWRPAFCPDRTCTPLIHPLTDPDNMEPGFDRPGFAVFCFGRLAAPLDWTFAGVEHHEDLSNCQSSPLKGNVRWFDNAEDWSALTRAFRAATSAAATPTETPEESEG